MARPIHVTLSPSGAHLPPIKSIILEVGHHANSDEIPRYAAANTTVGMTMTRNSGASDQVGEGEVATAHQHQPPRSTTTSYSANVSNNTYVLTQMAAPSRPAYYPSQPPSYQHVSMAQSQSSSQRMVYPRLGSVATSSYSTGHSLGYGPRPLITSPPGGSSYSRMSSPYGNTVTGQGLDPSYHRPQYHPQQVQPQSQQHQLSVTSTPQYRNQYQASPYSSYMQSPHQPHQHHQYGQQSSTIGGGNGYPSSHSLRRPTSPSMIAPAPPTITPRPYYDNQSPTGPYHNPYGVHSSSAGIGSGLGGYQGGSTYQAQLHPALARKSMDAPPSRPGGSYIMPSGPLPDSTSMLRSCANCGTRETPSWRRCGPEQTILCNACGLYYNEHKRHRQFRVNADGRTRAVRSPKFKLIEGDRCPECTVRGGEISGAGSGACGTCQYIRQQRHSPPADHSPSASSSSPLSSVRDGDSDGESASTGGPTGIPPSPSTMGPSSLPPSDTPVTFNPNTAADRIPRSDSVVGQ